MNTLPETNLHVHFGVDVAKAELVLDCLGVIRTFTNDSKGSASLLKVVSKASSDPHLVCEATGGYERLLTVAALSAAIPISVVQPQRVRHFARALGRLGKSDPLDAALLSLYGSQVRPMSVMPKDPTRQQLDVLLRTRRELNDSMQRELNRSENDTSPRWRLKLPRW